MIESLYVSTYLGNRFYPFEPRIEQIAIEDIAHGLAFQCRFNGQTRVFYSVAQHSLLVAELLPASMKLAGLLHDAAEAYLGDMVKPLKWFLPDYCAFEAKVTLLLERHFGLTNVDHPLIKTADLRLLATEKRDLMPHSTEPWRAVEGVAPLADPLCPLEPEAAKKAFLQAFAAYSALVQTPTP